MNNQSLIVFSSSEPWNYFYRRGDSGFPGLGPFSFPLKILSFFPGEKRRDFPHRRAFQISSFKYSQNEAKISSSSPFWIILFLKKRRKAPNAESRPKKKNKSRSLGCCFSVILIVLYFPFPIQHAKIFIIEISGTSKAPPTRRRLGRAYFRFEIKYKRVVLCRFFCSSFPKWKFANFLDFVENFWTFTN